MTLIPFNGQTTCAHFYQFALRWLWLQSKRIVMRQLSTIFTIVVCGFFFTLAIHDEQTLFVFCRLRSRFVLDSDLAGAEIISVSSKFENFAADFWRSSRWNSLEDNESSFYIFHIQLNPIRTALVIWQGQMNRKTSNKINKSLRCITNWQTRHYYHLTIGWNYSMAKNNERKMHFCGFDGCRHSINIKTMRRNERRQTVESKEGVAV